MSPASVHSVEKEDKTTVVPAPAAAPVPWFRSTYTQALVTGVASFLAPGMYAACAATGAGGLADVKIGNASVAVAFALIVPSALVATGFISKFNVRTSLAVGAAGYAPYAAALWFLVVGAVICGLTSGIFWVTEGTIIMVYSEPARKGRLVALWQSLFNLATLVGGAINLALNVDISKPGGLRPRTYLVFVGLSSCAPLVSLLLSNPREVRRADGRPVPALPAEGFLKEAWLTILELRHPRVLAAAFLWSHSLFVPSFFNFSVRVRGMSSIVQPVLAIICQRTVIALCLIWVMVDLVHIKNHPAEVVVYDWTTARWAVWWFPAVLGSAAAWVSYGYSESCPERG
ncbi:hypothetical protein Q8F55_007175 [Vanrija albida]|uniref:Major facilitator superfamily (MFS) profile domain-containing protein n=1 Tax=Vanrija albida TaxID=181172 RepID=A0ABR3PZ40_9TREE